MSVKQHYVVAAVTLLIGGSLPACTLLAGGWGVLTIRDVPDHVVAGEPFELTVAARGHGRVLSSGLSLLVQAARQDRRVEAAAVPASRAGLYTASLTLPMPGEWTITLRSSSYGEQQALRLPLQAIARGATPPVLSAEDRGQRLFLAKGCATCHRHASVASNHPAPVGPPLMDKTYSREFLNARLRPGPQVGAPASGVTPWTMPDLELSPGEIESLVAFLLPQAQAHSGK